MYDDTCKGDLEKIVSFLKARGASEEEVRGWLRATRAIPREYGSSRTRDLRVKIRWIGGSQQYEAVLL